MAEFWESVFKERQEMWGWEAADSAVMTVDLFQKHGLTKVLIPGFGYGRNAKVFTDRGFTVTGIEISETAIEIAKKHFGPGIKVHAGSVASMPFDEEVYEGIFCYALIHLLSENEREKLIDDCFHQLAPGGYMVFVSIAKTDFRYGQGKEVGKDTFETWPGLTLFFYDADSIHSEFGSHGLLNAEIMNEPIEDVEGKPAQRFWYIVCKK